MSHDPIRRAILKAHDSGRQRALSTVFAMIGRQFASQFLPILTKSHERYESDQTTDPELEADPHQALLLAQIDHHIRCRETGQNPDKGDRALHALWHDPEALAGVLAPHVGDEPQFQKAIAYAIFLKAAERSPKGGISIGGQWYPGGQWIPASVVATAKPEEKQELAERNQGARPNPLNKREKAQAAAAEKRGTRDVLRKRVADIATDIMLYPRARTPDKYRDLAEAMRGDHLSVADLRALRLKLSASFGGGRRKEQMVAALLQHAENEARDLAAQPPEEPAPTAEPKKPKAPKPGTFAVVRTDSLSIDPARFQFKQKVNQAGVTAELAKVKEFNPDFAGVISVWYDPNDGLTYVINGHHRFELARRTGYPQLAVRYLAAKDEKEVRAKGALINIAEGRGTALDAAKFLRDSGRTAEDLYAHGISPDGALARDAGILTKLNDAAFERLTRGALDQSMALAVAKHLADPARQEKLFRLIARKEEDGKEFTNRHVEEMARQMAAAPSTTTTATLWGDEVSEDDAFLERADLAAHVRAELAKEFHDYGALSSERRAGATKEAGNVLNVEENRKRAAEAEVNKHAYDTLAHRKGAVADALDKGAVDIKTAQTKKEKERVRSATVAAIRSALARAVTGREQPAAEPPVGQSVGEVGGGSVAGSGAERAVPAETGAGQAAPDGSGPRDDEAGLTSAPARPSMPSHAPDLAPAGMPEQTPAPEPTPEPTIQPELAPSAPEPPTTSKSVEASPLHQLAHLAGNPTVLNEESQRLASEAENGNTDFGQAAVAALRGEHGPEVRDAVSRALTDWNAHQGDPAKRIRRIGEEVAKIGKPEDEGPSGRGAGQLVGDVRTDERHLPKFRPHSHIEELHKYATDSAKEITDTPQLAPIPTGDPSAHHAATDHTAAINAIGEGDSGYVAGHRVRNVGGGKFQLERPGKVVVQPGKGGKGEAVRRGGFATGSAADVSRQIQESWQNQTGMKSVGPALARADSYEEPDPFTDAKRSDEDAKLRKEVPDGAKAVSLDENSRGRVGTIARSENGVPHLQLGEDARASNFEPLDVQHSWRVPAEEREAAKPKTGKTESMFGDESAEGASLEMPSNEEIEAVAGPDPELRTAREAATKAGIEWTPDMSAAELRMAVEASKARKQKPAEEKSYP